MSNRQKIEKQTNLLNSEWSKLRIQSIPLSTSGGALANKKVCNMLPAACYICPACTVQFCSHSHIQPVIQFHYV